jgi:predicted anti-sigma-YlaC factor YlaD
MLASSKMAVSPGVRSWPGRLAVLAFIMVNIADAITTYIGLSVGATELNPVMSTVMAATGIPVALALKVLVAAGVGLLFAKWRPGLLTVPTLALAFFSVSNAYVAFTSF